MIYQFERGEIVTCASCPCWCPDIISKGYATDEGCCYVNYEERHRHSVKPKDCPLVAISKTETTSCEWCEIASACEYEVTFFKDDDRWATERSLLPKFCPNCGRKIKEEQP